MIKLKHDEIRYGSRPICISLITTLGASFVCMVLNTRWPVREAFTAFSRVSRSLTSPIIIISGSCLNTARSPDAKVSPIWGFVWIWFMPFIWYSTGSSIVTIFLSGVLI